MNQEPGIDELMMRYLFGELSEAERVQVENRFLADNEYFEQLLSVEDALIDDYLLNKLSPQQRERMENLLMSSSQQRREMELARDLIAAISETESLKPTAPPPEVGWNPQAITQSPLPRRRFTLAVWVVLFVLIASLLAWNIYLQISKGQTEAERTALKRESQERQRQIDEALKHNETLTEQLAEEKNKLAQSEQLVAELQRNTTSSLNDQTTTIHLSPDLAIRGEGSLKIITIRADVRRIRIYLSLAQKTDNKEYGVTISTFENRTVWSKDFISANLLNRDRLILLLPANILPADDYKILVKARVEAGRFIEVANYSFGIRKSR